MMRRGRDLEAWAKMATEAMVIWCVLEVLLSLSLFLLQRWARKVELKVKVKVKSSQLLLLLQGVRV